MVFMGLTHEGPSASLPLARVLRTVCAPRTLRLGLEHGLDLQEQLDLVRDHDAAALDRRVPGHAEVGAVDLSRRGEPNAGAAVGVRTEPVDLELQRDAAGDALQR